MTEQELSNIVMAEIMVFTDYIQLLENVIDDLEDELQVTKLLLAAERALKDVKPLPYPPVQPLPASPWPGVVPYQPDPYKPYVYYTVTTTDNTNAGK